MKRLTLLTVAISTFVAAACVETISASNALASEKNITIGTAGVTGVYYPAGGAICRLVNRGRKQHGVRCGVESTGGSINNLELLRKRDLQFGVVQSDLLYNAYQGGEMFSDVGADKELRVLFSLHSEPFTVLTRSDAKIRDFNDLKGKKVDMGPVGSGMRATMEDLMKRKGWNSKSFSGVVDMKSNDHAEALCSGYIDAMVYAGGHPNGTIQQATSVCSTRLIDVSGPAIDAMVSENPFFSRAIIPGGMYKNNPSDVHTFGVKAVLVAEKDMDEEVVYQVVRAVFDNLDNFKTLHPVFATLDSQHMVSDTSIIPMHEGAMRYFRERGLLQESSAQPQ
ncbi:MAG: TAXI family TRAP transporter solute-binding subunit [Alphaproteobacteria bacterium]